MTVRVSLVVLLAVSLCSCGGSGSYELRWTIGCKTAGDPSCAPRSAYECSRVGIDSVEIFARRDPGATPERAIFPCFSSSEGPVARGPGLDAASYALEVQGLSPGGQLLSGPVSVSATIPETGFVKVQVDLPIPAACGDGVDNDGDGMVDLQDPGCKDPRGTSE
jgi:hypothetical protein